jgi:hypothetical protein
MAFREDVRLNPDVIAHNALHGIAAAIYLRLDMLDDDTLHARRAYLIGQGRV